MNIPNLFKYAQSELSQDAVICWIISWAKSEYANEDRELHELGKRFLNSLFAKHNISIPNYDSIEVLQQDNYIDIGVIINGQYYLLIEDKTGTNNHSNQLNKYFEHAQKKYTGKKIIPIYFKTKDQSRIEKVRGHSGFEAYTRVDFLSVLNSYKGANEILLHYRHYLQGVENSVASFKTKNVQEWNYAQWVGLYKYLEANIDDSSWRYVANPSGGFYGFYLVGIERPGIDKIYLQIEATKRPEAKGKLCFKIKIEDPAVRSAKRNEWSKKVLAHLKANDIKATKPKSFGKGKYMTVAVLENDIRESQADNKVDEQRTLNRLRSLSAILEEI